jgi:hypothetical protein
MRSIGGLLFFFGLGSVILDLFNYQFAILAPIEEYQPAAGIILAVIGAVLVGLGVQQDQNAKRRAEAETASMAPPSMATDPMAASTAPMAPSSAPLAASSSATESSWSSTPTPPPASPAPDVASAPAPAPDVAVTTDPVRSDDMGTSERTDPDRPA